MTDALKSTLAIEDRVVEVDWKAARASLDGQGYAVVGPLLSRQECGALAATFDEDRFRKHIVMEKHTYGRGDYKYFRYPLPDVVEALRSSVYPRLVDCANRWADTLGRSVRYPPSLPGFLAECHAMGQERPTPLILRYGAGGYNRLHQDLYGDLHFPIQLALLLSAPERDFTGGEFVLTEQRARVQARPHIVPLDQGQAVLFAVHQCPTQGVRGPVRVQMRHGVATIRSGERLTLGVIFHDAE
ncbi:MAG: 2OG-Fe(II) oxygenase [Myxococcota bacterium]